MGCTTFTTAQLVAFALGGVIAIANPNTYQVDLMRMGDAFPLLLSIAVSVSIALGRFLSLVFLVSRAEPLPGQR